MKQKVAIASAVLAVFMALVSGCRLRDERTVVISTPGIHNEACVARARAELLKLKGVEYQQIVFDLKERTVTITYDSMQLGRKNLEHAICDAGFAANDLDPTPEAVAALPAACMVGASPAVKRDANSGK